MVLSAGSTASFVNEDVIVYINDTTGDYTIFFKDDATDEYITNAITGITYDAEVCEITLSHSPYDHVTIHPIAVGFTTLRATSSTYTLSNSVEIESLNKDSNGKAFMDPRDIRCLTKATLGTNMVSSYAGFKGAYNLYFIDASSCNTIPTSYGELFDNADYPSTIFTPCGMYNDWILANGWEDMWRYTYEKCQGNYGKLWYSETDDLEETIDDWTEVVMSKAEWDEFATPDDVWWRRYIILDGKVISKNKIRKVEIGSEPTVLGENFGAGCLFFEDIVIPSNITKIGNYFLYEGIDEKNINIDIPNTVTEIGNSFLGEIGDYYADITIPNSVTSIGNDFLYYPNHYDGTITLSNSLETIGDNFMYRCDDFTKPLVIPNSVEEIGKNFMHEVDNFIGPLTVPSGVTFTEDDEDYPSLATEYTSGIMTDYGIALIGDGVDEWLAQFPDLDITEDGFYRGLYDGRHTKVKLTLSGSNLSPTLNLYAVEASSILVTWGDGATETWNLSVGNNSKSHTYSSAGTYTVDLKMSGKVYLGTETSYGFVSPAAYKTAVTELEVGAYVVKLNKSSFMMCSNLTLVNLEKAVLLEEICEYSFDNTGFEDIIIPPRVTTIGPSAFASSSLTYAEIPDNVTSIGEGCFSGCTELTEILLGEGITVIPGAMCDMCTKLTEVTFNGDITTIGYGAFSVCAKLYAMHFPNSLQTIDCDAFAYCGRDVGAYLAFDNFDHIPVITGDACEYGRGGVFNQLGGSGLAVICVPRSLKTAWKSAQYWSNYANKISSGAQCGVE